MNSPTIQMAFTPAQDLAAAEAHTRQLAHRHYENFSVVSMLLPRHLRQDFCNIYAFCRVADDLGDEIGDPQQSLELLGQFRRQTQDCFNSIATTSIFVALRQTIQRHDVPIQPFLDLIDAFEQDQRVSRYKTFDQVLDYCRRSANPVGRLVLYICGYRDAQRHELSDHTCTALQLANFWQDVRRDIVDRNRIYIPEESMARFGVTEAQIRELRCNRNYCDLIHFEVDRAQEMFDQGQALLPMLRPAVRLQISLFGSGGRAVLASIRRQEYDTLTRRPVISQLQKGRLIAKVLAGYARTLLSAKEPA